ncbi:hypothetical protein [Elizabethkingia anophelis]|uniref:hypothetical protein n=1 Tax=Elizabethkingia anophelis TaxID=1117645 RepID=UPI000442B11B|nr:hypothetical protein [Elizabethkingia anophelis]MDV3928729.1 hypothetical protein [Elizabethkingia anophelis]MDV4023697.1 hypothetical protein [Elizabethkingia anophelis]CDN74014.1 membrane hypothetical protein [Elizabethkingia anophelis]CDN77323.1 membrane hypothetical protein [Elizabethkingia anophelis]
MWKYIIKWLKKELDQTDQDQQLKEVESYMGLIETSKSKSQDDFEKYLYLLGSGGLIISLLVIEKSIGMKIIKCTIFLLLFSSFCFAATLLSNLLSHRKSIKVSDELLDLLNEDREFIFNPEFNEIHKKGNNNIDRLNKISITSLIIGIFSILIFFTINLIFQL